MDVRIAVSALVAIHQDSRQASISVLSLIDIHEHASVLYVYPSITYTLKRSTRLITERTNYAIIYTMIPSAPQRHHCSIARKRTQSRESLSMSVRSLPPWSPRRSHPYLATGFPQRSCSSEPEGEVKLSVTTEPITSGN